MRHADGGSSYTLSSIITHTQTQTHTHKHTHIRSARPKPKLLHKMYLPGRHFPHTMSRVIEHIYYII